MHESKIKTKRKNDKYPLSRLKKRLDPKIFLQLLILCVLDQVWQTSTNVIFMFSFTLTDIKIKIHFNIPIRLLS